MATPFERAFVQHLCISDSLKEIIERELPEDLMPSPDVTSVFNFAREYWHADEQAPSPEVMEFHFSNMLAEHEIDLTIDPEGGLEWCLVVAENAYIDRHWQPWVRDWTTKVSSPEVDILGKITSFDEAIQHLMGIQSKFTKKSEHAEVGTHGVRHLDRYAERAGNTSLSGIPPGAALLGIPDFREHGDTTTKTYSIDEAMGGTRLGELTIVAGPPKSGKSFMLANGAYEYWLAGGTPVLYTLENAVDMTLDRVICMRAGIDSRRWERGQCTPEEVALVQALRAEMLAVGRPFHILQPEPGKRTVEHLVRRARTLGDAIYIDQLTFVEPSIGSERKQRYQQVGDMLHELKALISSGRRIPCIMAHQINREGVKAAEKTGHLEMYHLAESAEVERTADRVLGLWQSPALRDVGLAWLQTLAVRRSDLMHWEIRWQPFQGDIAMRGTIDLPEIAA